MSAYAPRPIPSGTEIDEAPYSSLVRRLLLVRGITKRDDAERFLIPDWERDTHDPFLMKDMQTAVDRILRAMEGGETITIWSDYDMDGIPGAALLYDCFRTLGYKHVLHHTPHRNKDGFGLNRTGLEELKDAGTSLVITIDCGIGDVEQVAYANTLGLDVIVTDHHLPHETLPPALAILNPKQEGCTYPEKMLCGAGVAFKLVQALLAHIRANSTSFTAPTPGWERWLLDMAGMSTIADMVPLQGENRAMAHFGLVVLRKSRRPGLQALLKKARANQRMLTEDDVGFTIAPRINAASRMGHARDAFRLLSTQDMLEAEQLAEALDRINKERKTVVATMKREIQRRIERSGEPKSVIVMGNPEWKPSLLGLVAGGLAEEYGRPVFLWGREEGTVIKGSCRSDGVTNVFEVMHEVKETFVEYGGHAYSGGFSLAQEQVHALEEALVEAHAKLGAKKAVAHAFYDAELVLGDITWDTYRSIQRLAPFGEGNPKPLFMLRDVTLSSVRTFGKGNEHLEVSFGDERGGTIKAIAFFSHADAFSVSLHTDETVSLLVHLEASYFRYKPELRLRLIDVV